MVELFETKAGILTIDVDNNKVKSGKLRVLSVDRSESSSDEKDVKTLRMCGTSDELYTRNKYRHFSEVVNLIKSEAKNLEEQSSKYSRDMNIEQMKEFVAEKLPKVAAQKKMLFKHLIICERIVQEMSGNFERQQNVEEMILRNSGNKKQILGFIDEQLHTNAHQSNILRLVCLLHICVGGLSADEVNKFIGGYANTFGHKHLEVFMHLSKAKLFPDITRVATKNFMEIAQSSLARKTQFQVDAVKLNLIPADETGEKRDGRVCPSFVFNGNFIPTVAQLASFLLKAESLTELGSKYGNLEDLKVTGSAIGDDLETWKDVAAHSLKLFPIKPRTLFIFIVGGITYAEIAACSMVESLTGSKIVLASDRMVSGTEIIKSTES